MAHYIRILGRLAGHAVRSHAFDRAVTAAAGYFASELKLADLRAKSALLKRKKTNHLRLLGKTVFRLIQNDIDPLSDEHVIKIVNVLNEIGQEIATVEEELKRRRKFEKERRKGEGAKGQGKRQAEGRRHKA